MTSSKNRPYVLKRTIWQSALSSHLCDPNYRPYRYVIAILLAFVQGALSYSTDLPAGIQATMIRVLKIDATEYNAIFCAYSWADIGMSFIGSFVVSRYLGVRKGLMVFVTCFTMGQLMCSFGCYLGSFWVVLAGRILFGCGCGTTYSIANSFEVLWFKGKEITFVFSLMRSVCRLMATLALLTPQLIYDELSPFVSSPLHKLAATQMIGTLLCIAAVMCAFIIILMDKHGAKLVGRKSPKRRAEFSIRSKISFPISFWIIATSYSIYYSAVIVSLTANNPLFFINKYGLNLYMANLANSLSLASIAILTPLIGLLIDFTGYNLIWCCAGLCLAIIPCVLYTGGGNEYFIPFIASVLFSISYSLFGTAISVTPAYVVEPHQVTTAYGTMMAIFGLSESLMGVMAGVGINYWGYFGLTLSTGLCFIAILMFIVALFVSEFLFQEKRVLNVLGRERRQIEP